MRCNIHSLCVFKQLEFIPFLLPYADSYRLFKNLLALYRVDKLAKDRYRAAVVIQYFWRLVTAKSETAVRALGIIQKFVDAKTELPYW